MSDMTDMTDPSNGYERIADLFINSRGLAVNGIGASTARAWAKTFPKNATVLDIACGTGIPVTKILLEAGLNVFAIDASPKMIAAFRRNFPTTPVACEAVQQSAFFHRTFDGIISVGLMFLLPEEAQKTLICKMAAALNPGGRLLFTSTQKRQEWNDAMTELPSISLGTDRYRELILASGLSLGEELHDEGDNHYFSGVRPADAIAPQPYPALTVIDVKAITDPIRDYKNLPATLVNDHVVRIGVMTEPYFWHLHPESDETFLSVEGSLLIDLAQQTIELQPGQLFTIPRNVVHRTRPGGPRSVNLTFESEALTTIRVERPDISPKRVV
jgi:SAM-dependent methyltransferase